MLYWPKTVVSENNSGRECCWPYLIGQHPLSPVFGQKRPGTPGNSYFAQLPPVFGHFMFLSGGLLDYSNRSTWAARTIDSKFCPGDVEIDHIFSFFCNNFGANPSVYLGDTQKLYYTSPNHNLQVRCRQRYLPFSLLQTKAELVQNYLEDCWPCDGGLSAVNAIGTQLRDPINSGLIRWRMAVLNK